MREQANKKWTSENSRRIFEKLHLRRLKDLFDLIDSDKDGEISEEGSDDETPGAFYLKFKEPVPPLVKKDMMVEDWWILMKRPFVTN